MVGGDRASIQVDSPLTANIEVGCSVADECVEAMRARQSVDSGLSGRVMRFCSVEMVPRTTMNIAVSTMGVGEAAAALMGLFALGSSTSRHRGGV